MNLRPKQSDVISSALLASALVIAMPAWASQPTTRKSASQTKIIKSHASASASHAVEAARATAGTEAGLAAAGAAGAIGLIAGGGAHSGQGGDSIGANAGQSVPAVLSAPAAQPTPSAVTVISAQGHPVLSRIRSYVTLQPPALVVTAAMHRRRTTTSADIPTPYPSTIALLQVRRVDRIINQTTPDVTQAILPAHAVDRGIGFITPINGPGGTPEPAPGMILLGGVLGIGALILARKQRLTTL